MDWMTFDLDGVLMENPFQLGVFPHIVEHLVRHCQEAGKGRERESEVLRREIFRRLLAIHRKRLQAADRAYQAYDWDAIVAELADDYGCREALRVEELVQHYCHEPYIKRYDEADRVLSRLKEQGWRIGVITNGYTRYQVPVLEALGLYSCIDTIVTPDTAYGIKPESVIFHAIPGVRDGVWIHVGDTLTHDIYGGREAGAQTAWIHRQIPDELREISPERRARSPLGRDWIARIWEQEAARYPDVWICREDCIPDWIISDLAELLLLKGAASE